MFGPASDSASLPRSLAWCRAWVWVCVWCHVAGWGLSALGALGTLGYGLALGLTVLGLAIFRKRLFPDGILEWLGVSPFPWRGPRSAIRRVLLRARRRPLYGIYLLVFLASLVGGLLYAPNVHDALTYRVPRVLHWLWEGRWHWITTPEPQMNLSTHGYEWLMAPLLSLTGTDRLFFLPNLLSFALLPGLIFLLFVQLGVSRRVAMFWMWLLPAAYGVALEAGSVGNDLFALPYLLAGLVFAIRARNSQRMEEVALAILCAALLTSTKLSNAPLALAIAVALAFSAGWFLRWRHLPACLGAMALGAVASAMPVLVACLLYTGSYTGDPENVLKMRIDDPAAGVVGNSLQVLNGNLMPPLLPGAGTWNACLNGWLAEDLTNWLVEKYPRFELSLHEIPQANGLGLGLLMMTGLAVAAAVWGRFRPQLMGGKPQRQKSLLICSVVAAVAVATLVYLSKMGSESAPRLMLPYYPLLLVPMLWPAMNTRLVRQRWWRAAALLVACGVLPALVLNPERPLLPMRTLLAHAPESLRSTAAFARVDTVYRTYAARSDAMAPLREFLPVEAKTVGVLLGGRSLRTGLCRPYGARTLLHLPWNADRETLATSACEWFVADEALILDETSAGDSKPGARERALLDWAASRGLERVGGAEIPNYASRPAEHYSVFRRAELSGFDRGGAGLATSAVEPGGSLPLKE